MTSNTKIEWADHTHNHWIGCDPIAPECDNCYAEISTPARALGIKWGPKEPRHLTAEDNRKQPHVWNRRHAAFYAQHRRHQRVFTASLSDVFDNKVPPAWREELFQTMRATPNLRWMVLTKRIGNVLAMVDAAGGWPVNAALGITAGTQKALGHGVPLLCEAALQLKPLWTFLSMEPLLEAVVIPGFNSETSYCPRCRDVVPDSLASMHERGHGDTRDEIGASFNARRHCANVYDLVNQIIVGGESGRCPRIRPMAPQWVRSLRDQARHAGAAFFFKQWGAYLPEGQFDAQGMEWQAGDSDERVHRWADGTATIRVGKEQAGRKLDGEIHDWFPEVAL